MGEQSHREHRGTIPLDGRCLGIILGFCLERLGNGGIIDRRGVGIGDTVSEEHNCTGGSCLRIIQLIVRSHESFILAGSAIKSETIHFFFQLVSLTIPKVSYIQSIQYGNIICGSERDDGNAIAQTAVPRFVIGFVLVLVVVVDYIDKGVDGAS